MSKTPSQTVINASDDPGLLYLTPKPKDTIYQATVETNIGNVTTRFVPVTQQVVNLFNNNTTVSVTNEVAGSSGELQFNVGGHFSSDSDLRYNSQSDTMSIKNLILSGTLTIDGSLFTGSYNDLTDLPSIPSDISDLTDNNGLLGQGGGSGASFDQSLNTTDSPTFTNLALTGELQLPNYVKQNTNQSTVCNANVDTIVYTGTDQWQHSFKLLFKVEGVEVEGQQWDTQTCEMTVAKSFRNNSVVGSVYGLVYTSANPLATFTARWNATSNRVEILCRPSSTTFGVEVRSFVTEITTSD